MHVLHTVGSTYYWPGQCAAWALMLHVICKVMGLKVQYMAPNCSGEEIHTGRKWKYSVLKNSCIPSLPTI